MQQFPEWFLRRSGNFLRDSAKGSIPPDRNMLNEYSKTSAKNC